MSFKKKIYKLTWEEGHPYHGLEIRIKGLAFGDLSTLQDLRQLKSDEVVAEEVLAPVLELFASKIVSWNFEDYDGTPIEVSVEGVKELDTGIILESLTQWQEATMGVAAPLGKNSNSGETSLEDSIPMETL